MLRSAGSRLPRRAPCGRPAATRESSPAAAVGAALETRRSRRTRRGSRARRDADSGYPVKRFQHDFQPVGVFLPDSHREAIRAAMEERADGDGSRGHSITEEPGGRSIPIERLLQPLAAGREDEDSRRPVGVGSTRLFEHLKMLRALASPRESAAIDSRSLLEPIDGGVRSPPVPKEHALRLPRLVEPWEARIPDAAKGRRVQRADRPAPAAAKEDLQPPPDAPSSDTGSGTAFVAASELLDRLDALADELSRAAPEDLDSLAALHPHHRLSGCNLLHYLALRRGDVHALRSHLGEHGLASFDSAQPHLAYRLHAMRALLRRSLGGTPPPRRGPAPDFAQSAALLKDASLRVLGPQPSDRRARIMVTVSGEEGRGDLIRRLIQAGMNCMRINCAHDGPEEWLALVRQLRAAEKESGQSCKILMDVSGPKPRTGPVEAGPPMLKWRPVRNRLGQLVRPAIIALAPPDAPLVEDWSADAVVTLPSEFLEQLRPREVLKLKDARGVPRRLIVWAKRGSVWLAEGHCTTYLTEGTVLRAKRSGQKAPLCGLPGSDEAIVLQVGDALRLTKSLKPGRGPIRDYSGRLLQPAAIGCTLGEAFCQLRAGQRVVLDDGKFECAIRRVDAEGALLDVVRAPAEGAKLRAHRGVNFPDSRLRLPALTAKDFKDLSFIAQHADLVGFSFVQRPDDVFQLQEHLARLGKPRMPIVLKVETRRALENLPALLWAAMRGEAAGVMIARGDLAVECGYECLAEIQEEILSLCRAAHLPVIWATQVLESLAKYGLPTRPEITDAAMSERADCVMLNKGPHIESAVVALASILSRPPSHPSPQRPAWERAPWP